MLNGENLNKKRYLTANRSSLILLVAILADIIVVQLLAALIVTFIAISVNASQEALYYVNMMLNICIQVSFLVVILIFTKKHRLVYSPKPKDFSPPTLKSTAINSLIGIVCVFACLFFFYSIATAFDVLLGKLGSGTEAEYFSLTTPGQVAITFFAIVIAAPICEELLFRGVLLSGMKKSGFSNLACVLLTGLAFSLMHMNPAQTIYQFGLGCAIAYITIKSNSLIPAIIMHAANNFIALLMMLQQIYVLDEFALWVLDSAVLGVILSLLLAAVGAVVCYLLGRLCEKVSKKYHGEKALELDYEPDEMIAMPTYYPYYPYYAYNPYNPYAFQYGNAYQYQAPTPQQGYAQPQSQNMYSTPNQNQNVNQNIYPTQNQSIDPNQNQTMYQNQSVDPNQNQTQQQSSFGTQNQNPSTQQGHIGFNPYPYGYTYPTHTYVNKNAADPKCKRNFGWLFAISLVICSFFWVVMLFMYAI